MIKPNNFFLPYQTFTSPTRIKFENNANMTELSGRDIYITYLGKKINQKSHDEKEKEKTKHKI